MARARNIKPGFFKNADLLDLPFEDRLLFIGLWTIADREGRMEDRPKQIKVEIFPGDNVDCDSSLTSLAKIGMINRYEIDGKRYLEITNFVKHQNPHCNEAPSTIPSATQSIASNAAPAKRKRSTVQAPCKPDANTMAIGLNPSSLNPDSPILNPETKTNTAALSREPTEDFSGSTRPGAVCVVLKSEKIAQVNPSHPDLLDLLDAGAQLSDFVAAAEIALGANKPHFGYVLGIVRRRLEEAQKPAKTRQKNASKSEREIETFRERDARLMRKNWEEMTGRQHPDNIAEMAAQNTVANEAPTLTGIAA